MKTTVDHPTENTVKLTISLGKDELAAAEQVALTKLAKEVKAPGFRKGNVPASVARKHIDANVLAEQTVEDAMSKAVADAFMGENLQVLERPSVEIAKFVPGQELEFTAEAPIIPPVKLGDYKKLNAKKDVKAVTADEKSAILARLDESLSEKKDVTRAAKNGDEVTIDFVGKKDGVAFDGGTAENYALKLGSNSFIPGFEEALVGHKADEESFDVPLEFPADYHVKDLAGQPVVFTVTLTKVQEVVAPKHDDAFAAKVGPFKTMKELEADITRELKERKQKEADDTYKDALVDELIQKSTVSAPDVLIDDQLRSIEQDMTQNLMYQGMTLDQYLQAQGFADKDDWVKREARPAAEKRVKAGLVLSELSKVEKVQASSDELAAELTKYRDQYKNNPEMAKRFDEPAVQRDVANRLITEKTLDRLVDYNTKK